MVSEPHLLIGTADLQGALVRRVVGSMIVRAAFGGMGGDVEMLTYAALGWMARVRAGGKKAERWEGRLIHAFSDLNADGRGGGEARRGEGREGGDEGEAAPPLPMLCDLASAERLLTAIPLSAVDFHISRVLDTALSQPHVHQSLVSLLSSHSHLSPSLPPSDTEGRVRVLAQSAMLHCSSSISSKTLWLWREGEPIPLPPPLPPPSLLLAWGVMEGACLHFAREHIRGLVGRGSTLEQALRRAPSAPPPTIPGETNAKNLAR